MRQGVEAIHPKPCERVRSLVPSGYWYHCPGEQNPADLPSRGVNSSQLIDSTLWMIGPTWISDPEFELQCPDLHPVPDECFIETRVKNHPALSSLLTHDTCQGEAILNCEQFSTLGQLLKVTAHVMNFISILKSKVKGSLQTEEDIGRAEIYWFKESQKMLTQSEQFSLWYCGVDGIWRCEGRLQNADLPELMAHSPRSQNAHSSLAPGDVVLVHDSDQPWMQWRLGRVERLLEGSDGAVRGAFLRVQSGKTTSLLNRPIRHLYPLEASITTDAATTHCATDQTPEPKRSL